MNRIEARFSKLRADGKKGFVVYIGAGDPDLQKTRDLTLAEEVRCQQKRDQPLQQRASPKAERGAEPAEQIVSAFVNYQVGVIDQQAGAMSGKGIRNKSDVEDKPRGDS